MSVRAPRAAGVAALVSLAVLLTGCGDETASPSATPKAEEAAATGIVERIVPVTLREGTNLAVAVSAAGERVLSLQGQLFWISADGHTVRPLTDAYQDAREPQFSPDGTRVAYHGYRGGNWDIWAVNVEPGSMPVQITSDPYDDREPQFTPDGAALVFASDRGGSYDIWEVDDKKEGDSAGQAPPRQLTDTVGDSYSPSVNERGDLAYAEQRGTDAALRLRDTAGNERVVAAHEGTVTGVELSPDASRLAYHLRSAEGTQLRVVAVDGGADRALSAMGADVFPFRAQWVGAEDLVYAANGKVLRQNLGAEGAREWPFEITVELTRHDYPRRQRDYDPDVERRALGLASPVIDSSGETIYFAALGDLWRWRPAVNELLKITDDPAAEHSPALSPDGTTLAYVGDKHGAPQLYLHGLDTGTVRALPVGSEEVSLPSWSPDGRRLAYFVAVPGNPMGGQLVVRDLLTDTETNVLTPMPPTPISWSADGERVAVTRLNPYSGRYREGLYELLIADVASEATNVISPVSHRSILSAVLTPKGAMTYVEGGLLRKLELDEALLPLEAAGTLTNELTDMPAWSPNGEYLVYLHGDTLRRLEESTGVVTDVTPQLKWQIASPEESYVVRAGRVFTSLTDGYLENQDLHITGARIDRITAADPSVTPDVDASAHTVLPGLFEMHAHMGETSEIQGRVWLAFGITTVRDPGSNPYVAKSRQEAWDSGRRIGPRTHITGFLTDGNRVYYSMAEGIASDQHLDAALMRTQQLELDFIKTYVRLPDHQQKRVVEFAHNIGIPVSSHELYPAVAHGMDHVEHIGGTSRRGYQPKVSRLGYSYDDVVSLLTAGGMGITATAVLPGFTVIVDKEPDFFATKQFDAFYGAERAAAYGQLVRRFGGDAAAAVSRANGRLLRRLTESGALLVTGTDAPFVPYGAGLHAEFRLYDRAGVPAADLIRQATIRSALAAGVSEELGTIESGKLADLVIVDGDPLNEIRDLDNVVMTIKNGERHDLNALLENKALAVTGQLGVHTHAQH